ncbi:uncharacterized protein LOC136040176 [Artemia franciscana]|uniref:MD-2-related lipid-recognition domain-containing protein n=1 Tax=Artemia franciscana TaxID=6661 RepID=A0AA88L2V0_ARTSF|nr:hypothetical protein QYM36_008862 [Artemia franciscana]
MKTFFVVLAIVAAASARNLRLTGVEDCGGTIVSGSGAIYTDPILVPGSGEGELTLVFSQDLPTDLQLEKRVVKQGSGEMVPCLGNGFLGSCDVDVCGAITTQPDVFCPYFPPDVPCECPLLAGETSFPLTLNLPAEYIQFGPGVYEQTLKMYSAADPATTLGCFLMTFTLAEA